MTVTVVNKHIFHGISQGTDPEPPLGLPLLMIFGSVIFRPGVIGEVEFDDTY